MLQLDEHETHVLLDKSMYLCIGHCVEQEFVEGSKSKLALQELQSVLLGPMQEAQDGSQFKHC